MKHRLALLLLVAGIACGDEPDFLSPTLGDFVEFVQPGVNETVSAAQFERRPIAIVLNFFPAEGFGFGALRSFSYDGEEVSDEVRPAFEGGNPPVRVSFTFEPEEVEQGRHTVQVVYTDSRGVVHRVAWNFTVSG